MWTIGLGIQLWAQNTDWPSYLEAARLVDELGYDHLWTWDHLLSAVGDPDRPVFEGYTTLAAWAAVTKRARLGLLVGANTFRNPALVAKTIATIDHISGGRAILGLGGGWHVREHAAFGIDFGRGFGDRLDWLEEALQVVRPLLRGEEVTHDGPRYRTDRLRLAPPPVQARIPIMVGGVGEKKTLRSVARHADMWNAQVSTRRCPAQARRAPRALRRPWVATSTASSSPTTARSSSATTRPKRGASSTRSSTPTRSTRRLRPTTASGRARSRRSPSGSASSPRWASGPSRSRSWRPSTARRIERLIGEVKPLLERG